MNFREACKDDAERIAFLHAASWRRTYRGMMPDGFLDGDVVSDRLQVWRDRLSHDRTDRLVFVAEDKSEIVGFICAFGNEDPEWGSYIDNLHVSHEYKGRKLGVSLMARAAGWMERRHPDAGVYLWVMKANGAARQFYERIGASNAGEVDKQDPAGGSAPNCRYVWTSPRALGDAARLVITSGAQMR